MNDDTRELVREMNEVIGISRQFSDILLPKLEQ